MEDAVWKDEHLLGIAAIDLQHKRIFDCFVTIAREGLSKHDSWLADDSFVRLVDVLRQHFALEESMMRKLGYPELANHIEEHRQFDAELHALAQKSVGTKRRVSHELLNIFEKWLHKHIMTSDRDYVDFFASTAHKNACEN